MDSKVRLAVHIAMAVAVIVTAVLAARGVGNIVAEKLVKVTPYGIGEMPASTGEQQANDDNSDLLMYNRNLFNQKAGQSDDEEPSTPTETVEEIPEEVQEIAVDGKHPVLTDLRVLLKGTQVASDPAYSVALFMPLEGTDARMQYLLEGDQLLNEAKILRIVRNRVYMLRTTQGDRLEYIDTRTTEEDLAEAKKVIEKIKVAESKPAPEAKPAEPAKAAAPGEISADQIKKVGADTYEIPHDTLAQIRKNPNVLKNPKYGAIPQIQPVYKGGGINGFRLLNVQGDSLYAQLGIKSGDTLLDVNGKQLDNLQNAMALFDTLSPGEDIKIKINRAGAEKTLTFHLK